MRGVCFVVATLVAFAGPAGADTRLDALVASYPDFIAGYDAEAIILKDGSRLPISDGNARKTPLERLDHADIDDMFAVPYRLGRTPPPSDLADDPGRARNQALFDAMYGDCRTGAVASRLRAVAWVGGGTVRVTTVNHVADRLADVARELASLPPSLRPSLAPSAGTFNCRTIAGTARRSMHAYAAAIDINVAFSDYWRWGGAKRETDAVAYKNRIPVEVVEIFEKHGFIWGGKWYHYDTMHFEYRPEIVATAK